MLVGGVFDTKGLDNSQKSKSLSFKRIQKQGGCHIQADKDYVRSVIRSGNIETPTGNQISEHLDIAGLENKSQGHNDGRGDYKKQRFGDLPENDPLHGQEDGQEQEQTLMDHLIELRDRLLHMVLAILIVFIWALFA